MVKHVILWTLKDSLSDEEKKSVKAGIKEGLEGLDSGTYGYSCIYQWTGKFQCGCDAGFNFYR